MPIDNEKHKDECLQNNGWFFDTTKPDEIKLSINQNKWRVSNQNVDNGKGTFDLVLTKKEKDETE